MGRKLTYPPKPWKDGQIYQIQPGIEFAYSLSLKKWVPITPGYSVKTQIEEAFGVSTVQELKEAFLNETKRIETQLDSDIKLSGRIWKTEKTPPSPRQNDMWYEIVSGNLYSYDVAVDAWVEIKYV